MLILDSVNAVSVITDAYPHDLVWAVFGLGKRIREVSRPEGRLAGLPPSGTLAVVNENLRQALRVLI